ncbi:efflux RND transporter permease subunit, partial [Actinomadura sp. BRA 177]|uniref:efflux RND transporter permease subunit n=1 Tax=Actinomadura sp. BRA 177 TaxID=2745202 RepID=UPI001C3E16AE
ADLRIQQSTGYPSLLVNVDRMRANGLGITERDVTNSMVASLAGSSQTAPTFWLNPANGVSYSIVAATPQYRLDSLPSLEALPVTGADGQSQILGGVATISRVQSPAVVTHYNIEPTLDLYANVQGRDLGGVARDVQKVLDDTASMRPKGAVISLHGQIDALHEAFSGLSFGLLGAVVLIYLLIVVNFQSWADPFVIITALPAALAGIVWMLFLSGTSLSVPALTGAILCMGVATANSILVVSFCRERLAEHGDALKAALEAGYTRFRAVFMTALAMIIGMLPLAIFEEQNAPLSTAVIGGLIFATIATLLWPPVVFGLVLALNSGPSDPSAPSASAAGEAPAVEHCSFEGKQVTDPNGRLFDTWSCPTAQQGPLFLEPASGTTTGYIKSSSNWFVCQKEGAANPKGSGTTWLYTQGDDRYKNGGWGWFPASSVSPTWADQPVPDIPACTF